MNLVILLAIVSCLSLSIALAIRHRSSKVKVKQQTGLQRIKQLKQLSEMLQKHRGLSAALCQGDVQVKDELTTVKHHIRTLIVELKNTGLLLNSERWMGFTDHWPRLISVNNNLDAEQSFKQHTYLIGNILHLLEDIAESSHLTSQYVPEFNHIGYIWRELLAVNESIGQSRAIGTSAVTVRRCSSVEIIRLKYLHQYFSDVSGNVFISLRSGEQNARLNTLIDHATEKTDSLSLVISKDILDPEEITIERSDYFELATTTMDALNQIFDYQVNQLELVIGG